MSTLRRMTFILLPLGIPLIAMGEGDSSPLIEKVRQATAQYRDVQVAVAQGFVPATPCVSGPNQGAMGVHYVLPERLGTGVLDPTQPQALIYEPMTNGALRLVGLEYIVSSTSGRSSTRPALPRRWMGI